MTHLRTILLAALVAGAAPLASACYVEATPGVEYGYEPVYYDGALVYYDDVGRPFYYVGGAVVYVPATSPRYAFYVDHWRRYGTQYRRWYVNRGARYRTYRAPAARGRVEVRSGGRGRRR
jgi:hypothetical protein